MQSLFAFVLFFYIADCQHFRSDYYFHSETNGWLKLHHIPATFHNAWLRCRLEGAVLASPSNTFIESAMQKEMKNRHVSTGGVITGIHATFSKGDFFSIDGIPLNDMQLQWMPNEPDNKNNDEECILYNANKTIADIRCSEIHPYFCYKENTSNHLVTECGTVDKDCEHFRSDYYFHSETNGWLKLHQIPATFDDAWLRCRLEGAVLASPSNTFIESAMQKEMKNRHVSTGEVFIGIHATPLHDMQLQWIPNEPANKNNDEDCMLYNANKTIPDIRCSEIHPYFCYKENNSELFVTECGTVDKEYNLDTRTGNCYEFHKHAQSWTQAFMTCSAEGGHLAVINSATEDDILKELFVNNPKESIIYALPTKHKDVMHIGFHDRNEIGIWSTIHGTSLAEAGFELWASGQPDNYAPGEHCGGMATNGKLYDIGCDWLTPFICEKSPEWLQNYY